MTYKRIASSKSEQDIIKIIEYYRKINIELAKGFLIFLIRSKI